ncbi:MAG: M16 family metallopeptidase [Phycisphaerae bacterium]
MAELVHGSLPCGIEYGLTRLPDRHVVAFQIRILSGVANEPTSLLGLARVLEETFDKGTETKTGRELADAFDAIGASISSGVGRETTTFTCTTLPEHFEQAVALHAEMLRTPTFPRDAVEVNINLAEQEFAGLEDDPQGLVDKRISKMAYGPILGRHALGELEAVKRLTRGDLESHWRSYYHAGRMLVSVAGNQSPAQVEDVFERHFSGFGSSDRAGRAAWEVAFSPETAHQPKELEQEHIAIAWPGVDVTHEAFSVQQVALAILSGGMSARLFTEVREKLALVYWVSAWQETPRDAGMIFLGASTTPKRCAQTYEVLLREVDRLAEDIEQEELDRAITGLVAQRETRGESTRARCSEMVGDLFFYGHPRPQEEKIAKIKAVTVDDVRSYLKEYPRDPRCVVTLGPCALDGSPGVVSPTGATNG